MYATKYRPTKIADFIGNKKIIYPFIKWLLEWTPTNKKTKCALISGLNGIGKSLLVELILLKHNYNIISLNIDEDRDKQSISDTIKPLLKSRKTVDGQENALVISDIDCGNDYGFMSSLVECIKMSEIPIICICDDRYSQSIKPILNYCYDVKLVKPTYDEIYALIYKVVTTEQIKIGLSQIKKLIEQSNGDIRFILNSLQINIKSKTESGGKNITSTNIFDTTGQLFSNTTGIDDKFNIYWLSHDIHTLMVQENYINNTMNISCPVKKLTNLCESAASLSDADLFDSMINGCNWEFESYVALSTIKSTSGCSKKGHIKFPQFFGKIATINKNRREKLSRFTNIK
jgi:replication factor C subunit 1